MKKSDFYKIDEGEIFFVQSGNHYPLSEMKRVEALSHKVLKNTFHTILNAVANAATSSMGNGDEKANVLVRVEFEGHDEDIKLNDEVMVKGNLDYYEMIEHAHRLRDALRKDRDNAKT